MHFSCESHAPTTATVPIVERWRIWSMNIFTVGWIQCLESARRY
jgi:hypothetical protein